jgi:hypothetical protein
VNVASAYSFYLGVFAFAFAIAVAFFPGAAMIALLFCLLALAVSAYAAYQSWVLKTGAAATVIGAVLALLALLWIPSVIYTPLGDLFAPIRPGAEQRAPTADNEQDAPARPRRSAMRSVSDPLNGAPENQAPDPRTDDDAPSPPGGMPRSTAAPNVAQSTWVDALERETAQLEDRAESLSRAELWAAIAEMGEKVSQEEDEALKRRLYQRLSALVVRELNAEAGPHLQEARRLFAAGQLEAAANAADEVMNVFQQADAPIRVQFGQSPSFQAARRVAAEARRRLELRDDPRERFQVVAIGRGPQGANATVRDRLTGERKKLQFGDRMANFRVESIDPDEQSVTFSRGSAEYTVER